MMPSDRFEGVLHDWLADAAPQNPPEGLHGRAIERAGRSSQRASWSATFRATLSGHGNRRILGPTYLVRGAALAAATALLGVTLAGVVGERPVPPPAVSPTPTESQSPRPSPIASPGASAVIATPVGTLAPGRAGVAALFELPFEYVTPAGINFEVAGSTRSYHFAEVEALQGDQGVTVVLAEHVFVHPCPAGGSDRQEVRSTPAELLNDLQTVAGTEFGALKSTTFAGNPALSSSVRLDDPRCQPADIHLDPDTGGRGPVSLGVPSRLIVAEVRGTTILVQIWAESEPEFAEWLPVAMEFVDSIEFVVDR